MRLYKYLPIERIDVLKSRKICFSSPKNLNDPFELKPPIRLYESREAMRQAILEMVPNSITEEYDKLPNELKKIVSKQKFLEQTLKELPKTIETIVSQAENSLPELTKKFHDTVATTIGMLCLTETPDNLLMWAHYASSHSGFVVELNPEHPFFSQKRSEKDEFRHLRKVRYTQDRPTLVFSNSDGTDLILTKSLHWSYEREWRMLMALKDATTKLFIQEDTYHLFEFPIDIITSITFGIRTSPSQKKEIQDIILKEHNHLSCEFYNASAKSEKYEIEISPANRL